MLADTQRRLEDTGVVVSDLELGRFGHVQS
jgi:hypothetical protein